jgi:RNA polymerase sigma-70 factor (ECF subfamily)
MTLDELYETYEQPLRDFARQLVHDSQRADDLVQDTFIRAMGHLELLKILKGYQRRAWLKRTLKNLFLDELAARKRQEALAEQLGYETPTETYLAASIASPNPFELVPTQFRDVFDKRYRLGMNSREIAEAMGIPAETVRSRLHLGLKKLRAQKSKLQ